MDKETILNRMAEINKAMEQLLANYNMLQGGKQECDYWLRRLSIKEESEQSE